MSVILGDMRRSASLLPPSERQDSRWLAALIHAIPDAVFATDPQGRITLLNAAAERLVGKKANGQLLFDVLPLPYADQLSRQPVDLNGTYHAVSFHPVEDEKGRLLGAMWSLRDVTKQLAYERLCGLGLLTAGLVHDMANPLMAVVANAEVAQDLAETANSAAFDAAEFQQAVADVVLGSRVLRDILTNVRGLLQSAPLLDQRVALAAVLDAAVRVTSHVLRKDGVLLQRSFEDVPLVVGSEGQLVQLFVNFLVNAAQAVSGLPNGKPRVVTLRLYVDEQGRVVAAVSDNGEGIAASHMPRLFEPLFTTKRASGASLGLGLSICQDIAVRHRGEIAVRSALGEGSTFSVAFPPVRDSATFLAADDLTIR